MFKVRRKLARLLPEQLKRPLRRAFGQRRQIGQPFKQGQMLYASSPAEKAAERDAHRSYYLDTTYYEHYLDHPNMSHTIAGPHFRPYLDEVTRAVAHPIVLDIGCGGGLLLTHLLRLYPSFVGYGFDLSYEGSWMASQKGLGTYFQADAEDISLRDEVADIVLHIATLHHFFRYPDRMLRETYRMLKPGGLVLIVDPNPLRGRHPQSGLLNEARKHLEAAYELLAQTLEQIDGQSHRLQLSAVNVPSERPVDPRIVDTKLRQMGFIVLSHGFMNNIAFLARKFTFGYDAALALDNVLNQVAPTEAAQFYFVLRRGEEE